MKRDKVLQEAIDTIREMSLTLKWSEARINFLSAEAKTLNAAMHQKNQAITTLTGKCVRLIAQRDELLRLMRAPITPSPVSQEGPLWEEDS